MSACGCPECRWSISALARISYKPNWHLSISHRTALTPAVDVSWEAEDSTGTYALREGDTFQVAGSLIIPEYVFWKSPFDFEAFVRFVRNAVHEWEKHEMDEWLKIDGNARWNPHRARA